MNRFLASALSALALAGVTGCMTPPPSLDTSLNHPSEKGAFIVALVPPESPPNINQIHTWQIKVSSAAGSPVRQAKIAVDGGMPQHGHGLPTRPQVSRELGDGTYLLEGMKFSMTGWWEIKLAIAAPEGTDKVTFNTIVSPTGAVR